MFRDFHFVAQAQKQFSECQAQFGLLEVGELVGEKIDFAFCGLAFMLATFSFYRCPHGYAAQSRDVALSREVDDLLDDD